MRDFSPAVYQRLLFAYKSQSYAFLPFRDFLKGTRQASKVVILRHDVDKMPENALRIAQLEHQLDIKGSYYFRIVPESFSPKIMREIEALGHEVGYHYEDLAIAKGNVERAMALFEKHLEQFRSICDISTICMHGSPLSKWDNRSVWKTNNYTSFGLIGEPYFDLDFSKFFYLTDTGRSWNKNQSSVRDKVNSVHQFKFKDTFELIQRLERGELPDKIMQNIHPQRWNSDWINWTKELVWQNSKNLIKQFIVRTNQDKAELEAAESPSSASR